VIIFVEFPFYQSILDHEFEGHPSGVGLVLLPLSRGETRATGSPALKAGRIILPLIRIPGLMKGQTSRLEE
jgi:hypothetical protein